MRKRRPVGAKNGAHLNVSDVVCCSANHQRACIPGFVLPCKSGNLSCWAWHAFCWLQVRGTLRLWAAKWSPYMPPPTPPAVLKNLTNFFTLGGDYFLYGRTYKLNVWGCVALMALSALCGAVTDLAFDARGYFWQMVNCLFTAGALLCVLGWPGGRSDAVCKGLPPCGWCILGASCPCRRVLAPLLGIALGPELPHVPVATSPRTSSVCPKAAPPLPTPAHAPTSTPASLPTPPGSLLPVHARRHGQGRAAHQRWQEAGGVQHGRRAGAPHAGWCEVQPSEGKGGPRGTGLCIAE